MKIKNLDLDNTWDFWVFITQPVVEREPKETDEHYREKYQNIRRIINER